MTQSLIPYPPQIEITPLTKIPHASIWVPGSKSIANRAVILAALHSDGFECTLENFLDSEDTEVMLKALVELGYQVLQEPGKKRVRIGRNCFGTRHQPVIPVEQADLFVGNSGTTMRFLTALLSLGNGRYRLDGVARMRERPIQDLLDALQQLGVKAHSENNTGCPPVVIDSNGLSGGRIRIRANVSSQFLSGLLMVAPFANASLTLEVDGTMVSEPYVKMTIEMMKHWGDDVTQIGNVYTINPRQPTPPLQNYIIEPDASAASYWFGLAAITGGRITVEGLTYKSLQGDIAFVDILERMGCQISSSSSGITVQGYPLNGIDIDMNPISDTVMTLAAVACFAKGPTRIRNVAHIRHKETDRISATASELRKLGAEVEEYADGLKVTPNLLHSATIETYNDHRMAMSMALVGLKIPGVIIDNPGCVAKTYPEFWHDLEKIKG